MSTVHPTGLRRQKPVQRAARLIVEGRVRLTDDRVYEVAGDHATYRVIAGEDGIACPCPAREALCAHVLAAAISEQHRRASAEAIRDAA